MNFTGTFCRRMTKLLNRYVDPCSTPKFKYLFTRLFFDVSHAKQAVNKLDCKVFNRVSVIDSAQLLNKETIITNDNVLELSFKVLAQLERAATISK